MRLSLLCLALISALTQAWQQPLAVAGAGHEDVEPTRVTLIDLLSASNQHQTLVHLLQRARLVPTLNRIANQTFFAPTDAAFERAANDKIEPWAAALREPASFTDNIQAALRQQLLYHLLNFTLNLEEVPTSPSLYETLLFPHPLAGHGKPGSPREPAVDFPDEHSLLGGQGQKLRVVATDSEKKKEGRRVLVGVNAKGEQGTEIVKKDVQSAFNGLLVPINAVLTPPPSIAELIKTHPSLKEIPVLYSEDQLQRFAAQQANLTLFAPVDEAWQSDLDELERTYLKSGFATNDMRELWDKHVVQQGQIGYTSELKKEGHLTTLAGTELDISQEKDDTLQINSTLVVEEEILAENGVVHIVSNLLLPEGSLQLTPEKVLLALNCTRFISLLHASNLSDLLQQNEEPYTVLAPMDEILGSGADRWSSPSLPRDGSPAMTDLLKYHLVAGRWAPDDFTDGMLLESELDTPMLKDAKQKIPVSVTVDPHMRAQDRPGAATIGFAEANVLGDPVVIGNSIIYLVSQILEPPTDFLQTAMTDLDLSTFVAGVYAAELDKSLKQAAGVTLFAPVNSALSSLGLAMNYLFLPQARNELRRFLRYHAIDKVAYMSELEQSADRRFNTLEGSPLYANAENGSVSLRGPSVHGISASGQMDPSRITEVNRLTSNGVLHVVDQALLPPTLDITVEKLMQGAKAHTMIDMLESANMSWVLKGQPSPEGFFDASSSASTSQKHKKKKQRKGKKDDQDVEVEGKSYIVLCPLDHAFNRVNLTRYWRDPEALRELVKQHIIPTQSVLQSRNPTSMLPSDGRPLTLADDARFDTLLSQRAGGPSPYAAVRFLRFGLDGWMVGIDGAQGDARHEAARVMGYGRSSPVLVPPASSDGDQSRLMLGGGLMTLDAVLMPYHPPWLRRHAASLSITALVLVAATMVALLGWRLWKSKRDQQYQIVETDDQS